MSSFQKAIKNRGIFPRQLSTLDNRRVIWQGKSYLHLHFPNNFQHERCLKTVPQGFSVRFSMVACRVTTNQTKCQIFERIHFLWKSEGCSNSQTSKQQLEHPQMEKRIGTKRQEKEEEEKDRTEKSCSDRVMGGFFLGEGLLFERGSG